MLPTILHSRPNLSVHQWHQSVQLRIVKRQGLCKEIRDIKHVQIDRYIYHQGKEKEREIQGISRVSRLGRRQLQITQAAPVFDRLQKHN